MKLWKDFFDEVDYALKNKDKTLFIPNFVLIPQLRAHAISLIKTIKFSEFE